MKRLLILCLFFCSSLYGGEIPLLKYKYASVFDLWCSKTTKKQITQDERQLLIAVYPQFQKEWDKLGPLLLETTSKIFKKGFHSKDLLAGIFLCKKTPSLGFPLLINGNWFSKKEEAKSPKHIVYITYHEILHSYLENNFPGTWSTKLAIKYRNKGASMRVLAHLHLMAIQKHVFLSLDLKSELDELIKLEKSYNHAGYKEAWSIVEAEGYQAFTKELL